MSDSEDQQQSSASFDQPSDPADAAETPKKVENGTSVIVEQPRLQTQTSVLDEGDDIDVECSSVANAADALKAQQEVLRDEDAKKVRYFDAIRLFHNCPRTALNAQNPSNL